MSASRTDYIYGRNPLLEWLAADLAVSRVFLCRENDPRKEQDLLRLLQNKKIVPQPVSRQELTHRLGHGDHQGVAALVHLPDYVQLEDLLSRAQNEPPFIILLDQIQDPHNLGAILRSADGAGCHGIIMPKDHSVELTPAVFKASAGAAAHVPLCRVTNLARTMADLKQRGLWLVGSDEKAAEVYYQRDLTGPIGVVMGSEGKGLRRLTAESCDFVVKIPMYGRINSLNVSVASGLLFFEVRRQRTAKP
ncbi:MAG TPA: 23S rRNA (guanosine(2251)-2'-O)-methyltransferase RlmB [bacterium]|mgnify:FL=1|nr:23S rRNA (guanosine(2251)-2'-O)-methyltransferase RlmB [bacterium]